MSDLPPPTPAGDLIRRARELAIPKLSRPEVAHRVGIDPGTLGNIERGYRHIGGGQVRRVEGDAATLAKLARELGISPDRMEAEGKRPDAASRLRELLGTRPAAVAPDGRTDSDERELRRLAGEYPQDDILQRIISRPGASAQVRLAEARGWLNVQAGLRGNGTTG